MNIRLQKYKKNRILGMNMYNAAIAAGYSNAYAKAHAKNIEQKLGDLKDYLDRAGLTDKQLALQLSQLLEATKVIGYLHQYKKSENGGIEKIKPDEVVSNSFIEIPDWSNRKEGLKLAFQAKGYLKDTYVDQSYHITYAYIRNPKATKEERNNSPAPLPTR